MAGGSSHIANSNPPSKEASTKNYLEEHQTVYPLETGAVFPWEIFENIADKLIEVPPPEFDNKSLCSRKPSFTVVRGFMCASRALHQIGMNRWVRVLTVRTPEDWRVVLQRAAFVRELICLDGVFTSGAGRSILGRLPRLHTVSIDAHGDVYKTQSGGFSYRDAINALPASLLRLEVTCAHGPDLKIIETVRKYCPNIEVMRLGRCTMFNRNPACEFWVGFPFDHDAYIAADGTDDYAYSVSQELVSLKALKSLRLGVYLVPATTVLAHRAYHTQKRAAPAQIDWQQSLADLWGHTVEVDTPLDVSRLISLYHQAPEQDFGPDACSFCRDVFFDAAKVAERSASVIIKEVIPSMETIEWMDWFTPSHCGISTYHVGSSHHATV